MQSPDPDRTVLLITADSSLAQRGRRIIAAARYAVVHCEPAAVAAHWMDADAVLVGVDRLAELTRVDPHRRDGVYVIAADEVPDHAWRDCVALGASDALALDEAEGWLVERLSLGHSGGRTGRVIGVRAATGGAGASVLAAGLALAAGQDPVVLVDTDLSAGWLDLLLGIEHDGLGWAELAGLRGRVGGESLTASVPGRDGIFLVAADRDDARPTLGPEALRAAVLAAAGLGGTVIIDDCRTAGLSGTARQLADATVLVTSSDLRGGLGARRALEAMDAERRTLGAAGPVIVAARTPKRSAVPTATFRELIDLADDHLWLSEVRSVDRRVGAGQPGLSVRDRLVRECGELLERFTPPARRAT